MSLPEFTILKNQRRQGKVSDALCQALAATASTNDVVSVPITNDDSAHLLRARLYGAMKSRGYRTKTRISDDHSALLVWTEKRGAL